MRVKNSLFVWESPFWVVAWNVPIRHCEFVGRKGDLDGEEVVVNWCGNNLRCRLWRCEHKFIQAVIIIRRIFSSDGNVSVVLRLLYLSFFQNVVRNSRVVYLDVFVETV